jgi:post-segregation antitoxin (ccd killing protein)
MGRKIRGDVIYAPTCLEIPHDLKVQAKELGINMSATLARALAEEIARSGRDAASR